MRKQVHQHLTDFIRALGVDKVFGIPGAPLTGFYAALASSPVTAVLARHETGAVFMADGFARSTGLPGVCCATSGPGVINAAAGMAVARADGVPVLLISAEVPTRLWGRGALQESGTWGLDGVEVLRPICSLSQRILTPEGLRPALIAAASSLLRGERGPVHLAIPSDVGTAELDDDFSQALELEDSECRERPVRELLAQLPVGRTAILAGHGVTWSRCGREVLLLAERINAQVFTTPKAKGAVREDHPRFAGIVGFGGSPKVWERFLSPEFAAVLVLGSSLGDLQTNGWDPSWRQSRFIAQVDICAERIGRSFGVSRGLVADASGFCHTALRCLPETSPRHHAVGLGVEEWRSARSLTGAAIAKAVSELATNDVRLFVDVGNVAGWFIRHFNVVGARRFFINLGAGCMGHSVAAAIGASLADPTTRTIAIIGDAAFAMYGAELHVAAEHQLPITVIVVNDGGHGMISHGERLIGSEVSPTRFARPIDFASLARGYRVDACTVATPNELAQALTTSVVGPLLIDARIGRDEVPEALQTRADNVRKMLKNSRGES